MSKRMRNNEILTSECTYPDMCVRQTVKGSAIKMQILMKDGPVNKTLKNLECVAAVLRQTCSDVTKCHRFVAAHTQPFLV